MIRLQVHEDYTVNLKSKILALKNRDLNKIQFRADYNNVLTIIPNPNKKYKKKEFNQYYQDLENLKFNRDQQDDN